MVSLKTDSAWNSTVRNATALQTGAETETTRSITNAANIKKAPNDMISTYLVVTIPMLLQMLWGPLVNEGGRGHV